MKVTSIPPKVLPPVTIELSSEEAKRLADLVMSLNWLDVRDFLSIQHYDTANEFVTSLTRVGVKYDDKYTASFNFRLRR